MHVLHFRCHSPPPFPSAPPTAACTRSQSASHPHSKTPRAAFTAISRYSRPPPLAPRRPFSPRSLLIALNPSPPSPQGSGLCRPARPLPRLPVSPLLYRPCTALARPPPPATVLVRICAFGCPPPSARARPRWSLWDFRACEAAYTGFCWPWDARRTGGGPEHQYLRARQKVDFRSATRSRSCEADGAQRLVW